MYPEIYILQCHLNVFLPVATGIFEMEIAPFTLTETMAARITASAVDFAAVGAKIPAAQKAVNSPCSL